MLVIYLMPQERALYCFQGFFVDLEEDTKNTHSNFNIIVNYCNTISSIL